MEFRKARRISLEALADKTGISKQQINRLEKNKRRLNEDNMVVIAKALSVTPAALITQKTHITKVTHYIGTNGEMLPLPKEDRFAANFPGELPTDLSVAIIKTDDLYPLRDGWLVFYSEKYIPNIPSVIGMQVQYNLPDSEDPYAEFLGKLCFVELSDGRTFLRELKRGSKSFRYNLRRYNAPDIEDVEVRTAHQIVLIQTNFTNNL